MTKATNPLAIRPPKPDHSHLPLVTEKDVPDNVVMQTLFKACSLRRAAGSVTEAKFVAWLCDTVDVTMIDGAGNIHCDYRTDPSHRTMFTAHTDTVHNGGGPNTIRLDGGTWRADGAALGADDGAGIALMLHMIDEVVPGYYVFFRAEEEGGLGSSWLAKSMPEVFEGIDRAIAFDRAGFSDVITHQAGGRCASDAFAEDLSDQLCYAGMLFMPSDKGVFTDTANLTHLVPECTNLSVGYANQHGDREEQEVEFLQKLAVALCLVKWDELPTERKPYAQVKSMFDSGSMWDDADELEAAELTQAVEGALCGWPRDLQRMLTKHLSPTDPLGAEKHLNMGRLSSDELQSAMELLDSGYWASEVLDNLLGICQVI